MSEITVIIRGMGGTKSIDLDSPATVADVRETAGVDSGLVLRLNGTTLTRSDEENTRVNDGTVLISAPAEAKHGALITA